MERLDAMAAKCSFLLSVCVLATCIVAGTSSPNTTGFLAQPHMVNHSNTTGPVPQNVSDVKSMLLDLAKKNITFQDMQDILAKVGADSLTKDFGTCMSRCNSDYNSCTNAGILGFQICLSFYNGCVAMCALE